MVCFVNPSLTRGVLLSQVRPYLMADGGNVALENIADSVVYLRLQGACGSCPSSTTTMTLGIKRRLMEAFPEVYDATSTALEATPANIDSVLSEIRPYLVGTGGGGLELVKLDGYVAQIHISGPAARVSTVRTAVTQKLRERIPTIAAVQIV
ncbi:hypothetical protein H632_c2447p0 [Helicosporidium sp. ATCC 50920]|nr:hypothetical protein H632_c2447p0 [Helicosporidium sp. ATCC 50920]|eukprot:KDD73186.1 hypothetical protein H632_c2447p0 [Helicosporidium sp. ATCC 50920]